MPILHAKHLGNKRIWVQQHVIFEKVPGNLKTRFHTGVFQTTKLVAQATLANNFCTALSGEIIWSKCCVSSPQLFLQKTTRFYWLSSMACEFCSPRSMKTSSFGSFISLLMTKNEKRLRERPAWHILRHWILWYHLNREAGCSSTVFNHRNRKCYLAGRRKYTKSTMSQTWLCLFKMFLNLFNTPLLFTTPWEHAPHIATCKSRKTKPSNLFSTMWWLFSHTHAGCIIKLQHSSLTWNFLLQLKMVKPLRI